ncbi:MAG: 50S ribosomal protein L24 [Methanomassiliicoccales archaeon]
MTISARKQRKRLHTAPVSVARKRLVAPLSAELAGRYGIKRLPVRKGDVVVVIKGDKEIRGMEGKVSAVDPVSGKVTIDGVTIQKADGKQTARPISYSNIMIIQAYSDKRRAHGRLVS